MTSGADQGRGTRSRGCGSHGSTGHGSRAIGRITDTRDERFGMQTMLLAIDVGNTNIVLGVFDGERLTESWRLATLRERTADELGILVTQLFEPDGLARPRSRASSCRRSCRR